MKATLIHKYDGKAKLIHGAKEEVEFPNMDAAKIFIFHFDIEVEVTHGKGASILGNTIASDFEKRDDYEKYKLERKHQ